jgi:hypothetical protein
MCHPSYTLDLRLLIDLRLFKHRLVRGAPFLPHADRFMKPCARGESHYDAGHSHHSSIQWGWYSARAIKPPHFQQLVYLNEFILLLADWYCEAL